jgi:hypothetical protein
VIYTDLLERLLPLLSQLVAAEREQGERVIDVCRGLDQRPRSSGMLTPEPADIELKRELGRLVEVLSRRSAKAVPFAKLGRAALADLAGDERSRGGTLLECEAQLSVMGF